MKIVVMTAASISHQRQQLLQVSTPMCSKQCGTLKIHRIKAGPCTGCAASTSRPNYLAELQQRRVVSPTQTMQSIDHHDLRAVISRNISGKLSFFGAIKNVERTETAGRRRPGIA